MPRLCANLWSSCLTLLECYNYIWLLCDCLFLQMLFCIYIAWCWWDVCWCSFSCQFHLKELFISLNCVTNYDFLFKKSLLICWKQDDQEILALVWSLVPQVRRIVLLLLYLLIIERELAVRSFSFILGEAPSQKLICPPGTVMDSRTSWASVFSCICFLGIELKIFNLRSGGWMPDRITKKPALLSIRRTQLLGHGTPGCSCSREERGLGRGHTDDLIALAWVTCVPTH